MDKKTAIIYGLGKRYYNDFFLKYLLPVIESKYEIIGVSDKERISHKNDVPYRFIERSPELRQSDFVIVTSDLYFEIIRDELGCEFGIRNIISIDDIEKEYIDDKLKAGLFKGLSGVEVGGPSYIFKYLYKQIRSCDGVNYSDSTVWWKDGGEGYSYDGSRLGNIILADAVDLSVIGDGSYEFCLSSNNLEHIANPLKAVKEFIRILMNSGLLLIIVPKKEECFDHNRSVTAFNHLIDDFENNTDEHDLTHLDEIMELHDFDMDPGVESAQEFRRRAEDNYNNRCLHHHVFDEELLAMIYDFFDVEIIQKGILFNNYYIIGRVQK